MSELELLLHYICLRLTESVSRSIDAIYDAKIVLLGDKLTAPHRKYYSDSPRTTLT